MCLWFYLDIKQCAEGGMAWKGQHDGVSSEDLLTAPKNDARAQVVLCEDANSLYAGWNVCLPLSVTSRRNQFV